MPCVSCGDGAESASTSEIVGQIILLLLCWCFASSVCCGTKPDLVVLSALPVVRVCPVKQGVEFLRQAAGNDILGR